MIPQNINPDHIQKAIEQIDREGVRKYREQSKFVVVYKEKHYPPKYLLSLANIYANGEEMSPDQFSGGDESNNFLRVLGFLVIEESNYNKSDNQESRIKQFNKDMEQIYVRAYKEA